MIKLFENFENDSRKIWNSMSKGERIDFIITYFPRIKEEDYEVISNQGFGTLDYYLMFDKSVISKRLKEYKKD